MSSQVCKANLRLEDYFDFLGPNIIRIKGHRINLEDIVDYYREGYCILLAQQG